MKKRPHHKKATDKNCNTQHVELFDDSQVRVPDRFGLRDWLTRDHKNNEIMTAWCATMTMTSVSLSVCRWQEKVDLLFQIFWSVDTALSTIVNVEVSTTGSVLLHKERERVRES